MKKLLSIIFLLSFYQSFGQTPVGVGNSNSYYFYRDRLGVDSGFVYRTHFVDTVDANRGIIKNYPGISIFAANRWWIRNSTAQAWLGSLQIGEASGSGSSDSLTRRPGVDSIDVYKNGVYAYSVKDSAGAAAQNLQQVTDVGFTTTNMMISEDTIKSRDGLIHGSLYIGDTLSQSNDSLVAFGSSITAGSGVGSADRFPYLLSQYYGFIEVNHGAGGATINNLYNDLSQIPVYGPTYGAMTLEYNMNDAGTTDTTTWKTKMQVILDTIFARGWPHNRIFLLAGTYTQVSTVPYIQLYVTATINIAAANSVASFNAYLFMQQRGGTALTLDSVHPNVAGHYAVAQSASKVMGDIFKTVGLLDVTGNGIVRGIMKVGVPTASTTMPFQVKGNSYLEGKLFINGTVDYGGNIIDAVGSGNVGYRAHDLASGWETAIFGGSLWYINGGNILKYSGTGVDITGTGIDFRGSSSNSNLKITNNASVVINDAALTGFVFRVEGNTNANLIYTDGTNDRVAIGGNSPLNTLDIFGDLRIRTITNTSAIDSILVQDAGIIKYVDGGSFGGSSLFPLTGTSSPATGAVTADANGQVITIDDIDEFVINKTGVARLHISNTVMELLAQDGSDGITISNSAIGLITSGTFAISDASLAGASNGYVWTLTNTSTGEGEWAAPSGGGVSSITGTANQISASAPTGAVTLSIPSVFSAPGTITAATGLTVTTGGATVTAGGLTVTAGGALITAGGLTVTAGTTTLTPLNTIGIVVNSAAGVLSSYAATDHGLQVGGATGQIASLALGTAGQVLTSNGAGADPSWQAAAGGGITIGTTTITSGTDTYGLFQDGSVVGEDAGFVYNKTFDYMDIGTARFGTWQGGGGFAGWGNKTALTSNANNYAIIQDASGNTYFNSALTLNFRRANSDIFIINNGYSAFNATPNSAVAFWLEPANASQFGLLIQGKASQALALIELRNSSAVTVATINQNGGAVFNENSLATNFRVESDGNANMFLVDGTNNRVGIGATPTTDVFEVTGNLSLMAAGNKIKIATGSNASAGQATLTGGTVTVSTTAVTANSLIFLTEVNTGSLTNVGTPTVGTITAGTSFVINSTNVLDASLVNWIIVN